MVPAEAERVTIASQKFAAYHDYRDWKDQSVLHMQFPFS
jgi:hypothetical protein